MIKQIYDLFLLATKSQVLLMLPVVHTPTFVLERNAKFQLGISVRDNVIFFPHPSSQIS